MHICVYANKVIMDPTCLRTYICPHVRFLQSSDWSAPNFEVWFAQVSGFCTSNLVSKYLLLTWSQAVLILWLYCSKVRFLLLFSFLPTNPFWRVHPWDAHDAHRPFSAFAATFFCWTAPPIIQLASRSGRFPDGMVHLVHLRSCIHLTLFRSSLNNEGGNFASSNRRACTVPFAESTGWFARAGFRLYRRSFCFKWVHYVFSGTVNPFFLVDCCKFILLNKVDAK